MYLHQFKHDITNKNKILVSIFQYGCHQFLYAFWPFQIFIQMIPVS